MFQTFKKKLFYLYHLALKITDVAYGIVKNSAYTSNSTIIWFYWWSVFARSTSRLHKIDVAYNLEKQSWNQIEQQVHHQFHNNHYRRGIGFDDSCSLAFLEQEIYGKAIIRGLSYDKPNFLMKQIWTMQLNKNIVQQSRKLNLSHYKKCGLSIPMQLLWKWTIY